MSEKKTGIITDCVCDLPKKYLKDHGIGVIYFLVRTDSGVFTDTDEITAENVLGYMETGEHMPVSSPPPAESYEKLFREVLEKYDEAVYISTGSGTSESYSRAEEAASHMGDLGKRVCIFDSKHLSTGMGHIVIKASEMAEKGSSADEITEALTELRDRVSTSFITMNADYLYRNGRASKNVKKICDMFGIHPVLMMKDGGITLKSIMIGNYEKASLRYVRRELKRSKSIDTARVFITHAGCGIKKIERIKEEVLRKLRADEVLVTKASATVSCNCGPDTFGVLFVNERKQNK